MDVRRISLQYFIKCKHRQRSITLDLNSSTRHSTQVIHGVIMHSSKSRITCGATELLVLHRGLVECYFLLNVHYICCTCISTIHYSNIYTDAVFTTNLFLFILNSRTLGEHASPLSEFETLVMGLFVSVHTPSNPPPQDLSLLG